MDSTFEASARYLHGERTLIEFADSLLVTDHPVAMGGTGLGPSPGDVLLAALTSSTVLAAHRARTDSAPLQIAAHALFRARQQRVAGPMATYTHLARLRRQIHVAGPSSAEELEAVAAAGAACAVAKTLAAGVTVDERVELLPPITGTGATPPHNETVAARERGWAATPMGELVQDHRQPVPVAHWPVSAIHLDGNRALVDLGHQSLVFGRATAWKGAGTTPMDTLLGALAACTAIFIGRWAGLRAFPIESVLVRVRASTPVDEDGEPVALTAIEKVTELRADLGPAEFEVLDFVAGNCVLGETLKRGAELVDDIVVRTTSVPIGSDTTLLLDGAVGTDVPCADESCCVPDSELTAATGG
jgi:uncharacterized OsmC-like protein